MTQATQMYALGHDEMVGLIAAVGTETSVLVQGEMGTGKSSLLHSLAQQLPGHSPVYFDCTTKDLGDIMLPKIGNLDGADYVSFATNEELGLHLRNQPIILMIDEYGKANRSVQNAMLRLLQERQIGSYSLHPESIIFATTNLGAEGVGDLLPPHARNRIMVTTSRKPTSFEWISWGINNNLDPSLLGWARDTPQLFQSFLEVQNPDENPYIFHPRATGRTSFVTPRSLHKASNLLIKRRMHNLADNIVMAGLIGTIGDRAALDLMAYVTLSDDLPTLESIKKSPGTAKIPTGAAAVCMVVYRTLSCIERAWVPQWMEYLARLPAEAQGLFVNGVRVKGYSRQGDVLTTEAFKKWAMANKFMFAADI